MDKPSILSRLGSDAELLTKSDEYLAGRQLMLCQNLSMVADELKRVLLAIMIKKQLRQTNCVAVKHLADSLPAEIMEIMSLPDAVTAILEEPENVRDDERFGQLFVWSDDGYDVSSAMPTT